MAPELVAYFDESGTHAGSNMVSVGGFIGSVPVWRCFHRAWKRELSRVGVPHFHAAELESRRGAFRGWSPKQSIDFQVRLIEIIVGWRPTGIATITPVQAFEREIPAGDPVRMFFGSPYQMSSVMSILRCLDWARERGHRRPITFYFESGQSGQGLLTQAVDRVRPENPLIGPLQFVPKGFHSGLEAADFGAYEGWKHAENHHVQGSLREVRKSLLAALQGDMRGYMMDQEGFPEVIAFARESLAEIMKSG